MGDLLRTFFLFFFFSSHCFAVQCNLLISSSFGTRGSLTTLLNSKGELTYLFDGFENEHGEVTPRFRTESKNLHLGNFGQFLTMAAQASTDEADNFFVTTDQRGILRLIVPGGRTFPIRLAQTENVTAATLYGIPNRKRSPIELYVASGDTIYRSTLEPKSLGGASQDLRRALLKGLVRITETINPLGGRVRTIQQETLSMIDFAHPSVASYFWIATLDPNTAMQVSPFEKVMSVGEPLIIDTINYLQVVSPRKVVIASEVGKVLVVDPVKKETVHSLKLEGLTGVKWISSISAHQIGDEIEVWLINPAARNPLYRWTSKDLTHDFSAFVPLLPDGAQPLRVTTLAQPLPTGYQPQPVSREGYFSNYVYIGDGIVVERILVLADNGNVYAWSKRSDRIVLEPVSGQWVTHSFSAPTSP